MLELDILSKLKTLTKLEKDSNKYIESLRKDSNKARAETLKKLEKRFEQSCSK